MLLLGFNLNFLLIVNSSHSNLCLNLEFLNFFCYLFVIHLNLQNHLLHLIGFWYFKQRSYLSFLN